MKTGDLVKRKFAPLAIIKASEYQRGDFEALGIVVEETENACKVMFPGSDGLIRSFLKSSLEVIG